jgi:hypothetical protein
MPTPQAGRGCNVDNTRWAHHAVVGAVVAVSESTIWRRNTLEKEPLSSGNYGSNRMFNRCELVVLAEAEGFFEPPSAALLLPEICDGDHPEP